MYFESAIVKHKGVQQIEKITIINPKFIDNRSSIR